MLTPMKWGHDMFDKMTSEETTHHDEEGTPPLEEKIIDRWDRAITCSVNGSQTLLCLTSRDFSSVVYNNH